LVDVFCPKNREDIDEVHDWMEEKVDRDIYHDDDNPKYDLSVRCQRVPHHIHNFWMSPYLRFYEKCLKDLSRAETWLDFVLEWDE